MIRRARPDEAETLLRIQREAAVSAFAHIFPPDRYPFPDDGVRADWESALADPEIEIYVLEVDGQPGASVAVGYGFLRNLYVLPAHQGSGVGSTMHDHALERLRELGFTEAKLWTLEGNHGARRFYERRGWMLNGETREVPFPPNPLDVGYSRSL
ncbi:MAG TPA: GNAT family N-acetyltransferase [Gaiellaceae bacterium]|nr:GNAT family N-acetyltransferase [Gaiellaceae bacterium]